MDKTFRGYSIISDESRKYAFQALRPGLCFAVDPGNDNYARSRASALNRKGKGPFVVHRGDGKVYVCMPIAAPEYSDELVLTFKILPAGDDFGFDHLDIDEGVSVFSYHLESIKGRVDRANMAPDGKFYALRRAKEIIYVVRFA